MCSHFLFFSNSYALTIVRSHTQHTHSLALDIHTCVHSSCTHTACDCAHTQHKHIYASHLRKCCCDAAQMPPNENAAKKNAKNLSERINASSMTKAANDFVNFKFGTHQQNLMLQCVLCECTN